MAVPLLRRTTSIEEFLSRSVDLSQPPTSVGEAPVPTGKGLPFAARIALWTAGLAVSGAVVGIARSGCVSWTRAVVSFSVAR